MAGLYYDPDALVGRGADQGLERRTASSCATRRRCWGSPPKSAAAICKRRAMCCDRARRVERRARKNARGEDETVLASSPGSDRGERPQPARQWIARYEGPWGRSVEPAFDEAAI